MNCNKTERKDWFQEKIDSLIAKVEVWKLNLKRKIDEIDEEQE